jgi:hypothetical protein
MKLWVLQKVKNLAEISGLHGGEESRRDRPEFFDHIALS